jgi:hypothetical protein
MSDVPPYLNKKPRMSIAADLWDRAGWLDELLHVTATEPPTPKPWELKKGA